MPVASQAKSRASVQEKVRQSASYVFARVVEVLGRIQWKDGCP